MTHTPTLPPPAQPAAGEASLIDVFTRDGQGGNPVPLVLHAQGMRTEDMQAIAASYGHESSFVLPATDARADWRLRYFVPAHEMEMCGHATVGAMWALRQWGLWTAPTATVETLSGLVHVQWDEELQCPWISQPACTSSVLGEEATRDVHSVLLGAADSLGLKDASQPATNAATSRVKTLVEMATPDALNAIEPDYSRMQRVCTDIASTGLYPFAIDARQDAARPLHVHARQFPRASGYPEDAATGVAAAALWGYLRASGRLGSGAGCTVWQGDAMGSPSTIYVRERLDADGVPAGCWLSGQVTWRN